MMLPLLAQANNDDAPDEFLVFLFASLCGLYLVLIFIGIFFLLTLHKALDRCSPRNRTMEPGKVWLNLIPFFNIVWQFITVNRVSESLRNEFQSRGWHRRSEDYGNGLGIATCALFLVGSCFALIGLICFILYWMKIAGFSGQLARAYHDDEDYRYRDDDDVDDLDRPRRRRRDDDDYNDDRDRGRRRYDEDDDNDRRPWDRGGR